jgi:ferredoxin
MIHVSVTVNGPGVTSRKCGACAVMCGACAVTKVIRNNLDLRHIHVNTMGTGSFPGVKWQGRGVDHPSLYNAEVKRRVQLYLYSTVGPS